jgi:membrane protease YdiL (CAAX protease family)
VLDRLLAVYPARTALVASIALYCLVHVWAQNPMLLVAALVLGAHWSYLYYRFRSLVPGLVSHALWDVAIFVLLPVPL